MLKFHKRGRERERERERQYLCLGCSLLLHPHIKYRKTTMALEKSAAPLSGSRYAESEE
jgi:hypothetical protein